MGFCTFDSRVHYYNLKANLSQPQMLVVPDLADPFLPVPDDLLVNLSESRSVVDTLLDNLARASVLLSLCSLPCCTRGCRCTSYLASFVFRLRAAAKFDNNDDVNLTSPSYLSPPPLDRSKARSCHTPS